MDACSIPGAGRGIVERVVAVLIGILLAVSAIELTQESVVAAASAGVVSYLALRLGIRGECGWGSRDSHDSSALNGNDFDESDLESIAGQPAGKD